MVDVRIRAQDLKPGQVIVSVYDDWGPNGELLTGDPFEVGTIQAFTPPAGSTGGWPAITATGRDGVKRTYRPKQPVIVRCEPLEGNDVNALVYAANLLQDKGRESLSKQIIDFVEEQNQAHVAPLAEAAARVEHESQQAPPSPFG
ncbi:hypothetical protein PP405_11495 [Mycobacteroides abscessus]|nr:hypothetical protein [Mycobacteroides abscessus]MDM2133359.1 hypothetical protein [Mycobacteroides abscessus]MDM2145050.1 hypothetical protein [Mycobacteroides abscessus]MDM2153179.1 hypothetical protein [Mycobacteroides abscessus]MDM2182212.1 hypothetical protein [Mycobacteroides abscessus]